MALKKFNVNALLAGTVSSLSGAIIPLLGDPGASIMCAGLMIPVAVLLAAKSRQLIYFEPEWCIAGIGTAPIITWACTSTIPGAMLMNGTIAGLVAGLLSQNKPRHLRVV